MESEHKAAVWGLAIFMAAAVCAIVAEQVSKSPNPVAACVAACGSNKLFDKLAEPVSSEATQRACFDACATAGK